ncbi:MAG: glycosyl transferase [Methylocystis sp.]|nr:MAG: glycosyl transferase [Methylocystis sp.]
MKFSVVTVCYNNVSTIADTLDSVARQSWADREHVIVDGASTDGTVALIEARADSCVSLVSAPDRGIYDAMNKGVARAAGDVICFLNADDFYADDGVLERVARLMEGGDLDAVLGDVSFFSPERPDKVIRRYDSGRFSPEKLGAGLMPAHPGMFMRREIFERVGPFRTDYRIAGDFEWIVRAFHDGRVRYRHVPEVFVRMRVGGVSTRGIGSTIVLNREILRACRENGVQTGVLRLLSKFPAKLTELFAK